jgi:hypothetical protein
VGSSMLCTAAGNRTRGGRRRGHRSPGRWSPGLPVCSWKGTGDGEAGEWKGPGSEPDVTLKRGGARRFPPLGQCQNEEGAPGRKGQPWAVQINPWGPQDGPLKTGSSSSASTMSHRHSPPLPCFWEFSNASGRKTRGHQMPGSCLHRVTDDRGRGQLD